MVFHLDDRTRRIVAGVLAAGIIGGGAAGGAATTHATSAPARPAAAATTSTVPTPLTRAETAAEDVIGLLERGKRDGSRSEAQLLARLAHGRASAALLAAGVPSAQVGAFQQRADRVAALSASGAGDLRVSLAANRVSQLMPGFYARFSDPVPPGVLALDYLDREVQLQSKAGDARAAAAVRALADTWRQLRPAVLAAGGSRVAAVYDAHVRALARASSPAATQREALHGLVVVDRMEQVFLR